MLETDYTVEIVTENGSSGKMTGRQFKEAVKRVAKAKKPEDIAKALTNAPEREAKIEAPSKAAHALQAFIERIERLEAEKAATALDISEVYAEAKATGFNVKIMRKIVRLRARDKTERDEEAVLLKLYAEQLGMQLELAF